MLKRRDRSVDQCCNGAGSDGLESVVNVCATPGRCDHLPGVVLCVGDVLW